MLGLFRIVEPCGGGIQIDGVDITSITLNKLRSSLSIIPQDPVLFSGTIRFNLDPFDEYNDSQLWKVLEKSHLNGMVQGLKLKLESPVEENANNFSIGQKALLCKFTIL